MTTKVLVNDLSFRNSTVVMDGIVEVVLHGLITGLLINETLHPSRLVGSLHFSGLTIEHE